MKYIIILFLSIVFAAKPAEAVEIGVTGREPPRSVLGAPLYPGSEFLRTMFSLDPFYESVFYVVPDPVGDVKNYFIRELAGLRMVQYRDENEWVWVFLLKDWIPFPDKPERDDLQILDVSPNVLVKKFQKYLNEPLVELFETKPDAQKQLEALKKARTVIRYTYRKIEEDIGFRKIMGKWKNTDRDLPDYYGSVLQFNPDSTYTFMLTDDNIACLTEKLSSTKSFKGKSPVEIRTFLKERNPEKGRYSIMRNSIDMVTDTPVMGDRMKSGLAEVKSFSFSIQLINTPRLTFIRQ